MDHLPSHAICQVGIIVKDIDKSSRAIADFFGLALPPAILTDSADKAKTLYHGAPTPARAKLAFFDMGQAQLELIEPDQNPSTWREFLDRHGEGVHHIAFVIDGMRQAIDMSVAKGVLLAQQGEYTGGRYAYLESFEKLGVILELLENDPPASPKKA
jgi:hypothetical protein